MSGCELHPEAFIGIDEIAWRVSAGIKQQHFRRTKNGKHAHGKQDRDRCLLNQEHLKRDRLENERYLDGSWPSR
jgi:hypothetical protein